MCGIAGFFAADLSISKDKHQSSLRQMTKLLSHRGPDAQGIWYDDGAGIYLGHRRLSILDLSEAGAQPMSSHCERFMISYNGEIYNTDELIRSLREKKCEPRFHGHSDTEILLEAFANLGIEKTLSIIKGMFAIALWDKREHVLHLIRDHLGKKPLYVGWVDKKIAFASELKSLEKLANAPLEINENAFQAYRYFGFIPAPQSIYKGIYKLPAGHWVTININDVKEKESDLILRKKKCYWSFSKPTRYLGINEWQDTLEKTLYSAVSSRMMSDVPLGSFLSGGIDSSLVTALMQEQSSKPIKSYSIGFNNNIHDESKHAERVAKHLGTDHTTYMVTPKDSLDVIPHLTDIYDEPFADYSQLPSIVLCQQAKKNTTVALSGDGGDELFCGYKRYFMLKNLLDKTRHIPNPLIHVLCSFLKLPPQKLYNNLHLNGKRLHSIAGFLQEPNFQAAVLRTLSMSPNSVACPQDLNLGNHESLTDLESMMMIDTMLYLPDDILVKVDRASMFSSLEVRSPLLDKDLFELSWKMPISDKIFSDKKRGKKPLYDLLCNYVPPALINRPKQGFTPPISLWLKSELKDWAEALIDTQTPLFNKLEVKSIWDDFQSGRSAHENEIWNILMAQSWYLSRHGQSSLQQIR